ncbi:MAG: hypothetical protein J6I41_02605, partial [Bacteroidales bacterium]|nr:hypothetical protein [Bacteroidales bacterium]
EDGGVWRGARGGWWTGVCNRPVGVFVNALGVFVKRLLNNYYILKISYLCTSNMTKYNPNMTLHKLFLNVKRRDAYDVL